MSQDAPRMVADDKLTAAIQAAKNPEEVRAALEAAMAHSGIASRDPITGRFVPAEAVQQQTQQTSAAATTVTEKQPTIITKVETIAGQQMEFTGTEVEVANQISAAYRAANAVKQQFTNRKSAEHIAMEKAEWERKLRTGQCTTAEFLENTHSIDEYLRNRGVDIEQIASERYAQSWAQATEEFLKSAEGADWPGGDQNREILGMKLIALGLEDASDKLAAIKQAYAAMKQGNLVIETEPTQQDLEEATKGMSPTEIMESWKRSQGIDGDAQAANEKFIETFGGSGGYSGGGSSGVFGK